MPTGGENNSSTIIRNLAFPTGTYEIGIGDTDMGLLEDTFEDINDNFETLNQTIEDNELATAAALNVLNQNKADKTSVDSLLYASSATHAGPATKAVSIPSGVVDSTSTSTAYTAQIDGITELRDGVCAYIKNGVVTSASGCTLNVNGLGAKPIYQTLAEATAVTTAFNINYTYLFIYNSTRVTGGCWDIYYGYNSNTTYTNASLGQGYGTCGTATATKAKAVTLSSYALTTGGIVSVKFTNAVAAGNTMNINSKGAKAIYYKGAAITDGIIQAGDVATFIYSTYYHLIAIDRPANNESAGNGYATCDTAAATAAKTATLANYELRPGGFVAVKFDNDVPASATLSVNSKTATAIYYQGAAITAGVINAGDIATFVYDGTNYKLLCVDNQNIICGDY